MKYSKEDKQWAYKALKQLPKDKDGKVKIMATVTHVARSGLSRWMKFVANGQNITWHIATLLDDRYDSTKGLFRSGCGMDMIFDTLANLNYKMATLDTSKTIKELLNDPKKPCGQRIYDDYFTNASYYTFF